MYSIKQLIIRAMGAQSRSQSDTAHSRQEDEKSVSTTSHHDSWKDIAKDESLPTAARRLPGAEELVRVYSREYVAQERRALNPGMKVVPFISNASPERLNSIQEEQKRTEENLKAEIRARAEENS